MTREQDKRVSLACVDGQWQRSQRQSVAAVDAVETEETDSRQPGACRRSATSGVIYSKKRTFSTSELLQRCDMASLAGSTTHKNLRNVPAEAPWTHLGRLRSLLLPTEGFH